MKRDFRTWRWISAGSLLLALVFVGVVLWFSDTRLFARDRIFRGKPESEWINSLKYYDDAQAKEWKSYGEDGIDVLLRGLKNLDRPGERAYRKLNRRLPYHLSRHLPAPKMDSTVHKRHCAVALLGSLGTESPRVAPVMINTALNDESATIRQSAIGFFITTSDDKTLGNRLPREQKAALLPALLSAVEKSESGNHNAVVLLRYFGEFSGMIEPTLLKALKDPKPSVRAYAAEALNRVAPKIANDSGATEVLVEVANHPDDQIAYHAVEALGRATNRLEVAVPALVKVLESTNSLVGCQAVWSLEWAAKPFEAHANIITQALKQASTRTDDVGGYAKIALRRWEDRLQGKTIVH